MSGGMEEILLTKYDYQNLGDFWEVLSRDQSHYVMKYCIWIIHIAFALKFEEFLKPFRFP